MRIATLTIAVVAIGASVAMAQQHGGTKHHQPYAGQQGRSVTSLSDEELHGYLDGRGMGLAKAAELNGYPGPMHGLELEAELKLTPEQRSKVRDAFDRMKAKATMLGARYVEAEKAVDAAFRSYADAATIANRVAEANRLLGEVRLSHLLAHLEITLVLTPEQRTRYAELRGYTGGSQTHGGHKH